MLFEMLTGQRPFPGPKWEDFERQHKTQAAPSLSFYPTWLSSIVQQCLQKDPARRFQTFGDLRTHLEAGLGRQPGPSIPSAKPVAEKLTFGEWSDKAGSLVQLGQYREALCCIDRALEYEPKMEQSVEECRKTLGASPAEQLEKLHKFRFGQIWSNKAVVLLKLARLEDALECCDQALERDPTLILTWSNKGDILTKLGRGEDALACYDRALELDPRSESIWNAKIGVLIRLGRDRAAEACYLKAMSLHLCGVRRYGIAGPMSMLGGLLQEKSETAFWRAVDLDPGSGDDWFQRGLEMISQQRAREAMEAFENAARLGHAQAAKHLDSLQRKTG
jgi:tetratricopeptide (TPR) repeat protein